MPSCMRPIWVSFSAVLFVGLALPAQEPSSPSAAAKSAKFSTDYRQAKIHYGMGLLCARNNRLLEATHQMEEAWKLDPTSAPVGRVLVTFYLALGRIDEALALSKKTLEIDPDDYETWYSYARQLREQGKTKEARDAMSKAAGCPSLTEYPLQLAQINFDLGIILEDSSDPGGALTAFRRAQTTLMQHRESLVDSGLLSDKGFHFELARMSERMARTCLKLERYDEASITFEKTQLVVREHLQDPIRAARLNLDLAKAQQLAGHLEKSLDLLDEFLKTQPTEIEPYQLRIALLTSMGREAEIVSSLKSYVARDKHNIALHLLLADRYANHSGEGDKAQEEYESVIRENPSSPAYGGLFTLLKNQGKVDDVLTKLDRSLAAANPQDQSAGDISEAAKARAMLDAIRQDPELIRQMIPLGISHGRGGPRLGFSTRYFLALLAARAHQLEMAEHFLRDCLKEPNAFPGFSPQEHEIYSGLLQVLNLQGKNEEMIEVCREGLKNAQATNRLLFHEKLSQALSRLGKVDEALAEVDQAIQLADEKYILSYRMLRTGILADGNQHDKAIKECQDLLKRSSSADDNHEIRLRLYSIYSAGHDNAKAEEQLRQILQDFPDDATAHNDLGYLMADKGKNLLEAEELIRKGIELDRRQKQKEAHIGPDDNQDNAAFVDSLGWVLFRTGRFEDALQELQRAAALQEGNDPVIWDHLGDVYFRLDQPAKAREVWTKAVNLYEKEKRRKQDDQYKELKHKLELLKNP